MAQLMMFDNTGKQMVIASYTVYWKKTLLIL